MLQAPRVSLRAVAALFAAAALLAALRAPEAAAQSRRADLSRLVVVGDSLSAGFQNGSLLASQQEHGYASLVADQAGVPLPLPLIEAPGIPNVLTLVDPGPPPVIAVAPGTSPGRVDPFLQPMNLAVPGQKVGEALRLRPDCAFDDLGDLVLGLPEPCLGLPELGTARSQVEWAEALEPTTLFVWLGNNDALLAVTSGQTAFLTPVPDFERDFREVMDRLQATGATLVVANLPDVTIVPFLVPALELAAEVAARAGLPPEVVLALLGLGPGDFATLRALSQIDAILRGLQAPPLTDDVVITAAELSVIRAANAAFNAIVEREAAAHGAALVDVRGILDRVHADGMVFNGQRIGTGFLEGAFSLDGLHPTNTAYAVTANAFIRALNTGFATEIPPIDVRAIAREDPLILPGVGRPAAAFP